MKKPIACLLMGTTLFSACGAHDQGTQTASKGTKGSVGSADASADASVASSGEGVPQEMIVKAKDITGQIDFEAVGASHTKAVPFILGGIKLAEFLTYAAIVVGAGGTVYVMSHNLKIRIPKLPGVDVHGLVRNGIARVRGWMLEEGVAPHQNLGKWAQEFARRSSWSIMASEMEDMKKNHGQVWALVQIATPQNQNPGPYGIAHIPRGNYREGTDLNYFFPDKESCEQRRKGRDKPLWYPHEKMELTTLCVRVL